MNPLGYWVISATGIAVAAIGAWRVKKTEPCRNFQPKANFAWSDRRLRGLFPHCAADLHSAHRSIKWDYLLIAGYVTALLGAAWSLAPTAAVGMVVIVGLPIAAGLADIVENVLMVSMLDVDDEGRFTFCAGPADSGRTSGPKILAVLTGAKFVLLVSAVVVLLYSFATR